MGSACPTAEDLAAFASAGLTHVDRVKVEEHLSECAACSTAIAAFIDDGSDDAPSDDGEMLDASAPRRYQLIRMLGKGGMGTVYEALEVHARRRVALKLAHETEGAEGQTMLRRFFREAHLTALLEHPHIVPVFDLGEFPDGTPYYTQRLIEGQSLGAVIAACKLPRDRLGLLRNFRELCDAVAHAHRRGIIHRDIKSANIIIGPAGETWVIDWGLARAKGDGANELELAGAGAVGDEDVTRAGSAIGTPAYMSPEQARGQLERVNERSDVWSLGAVLLEILSGKPPFPGLRAGEILSKVRAGGGPDLRALAVREVPPELATIASKALSIDPMRRYPSAVELAADVDQWMLGQAVSAHRYSSLQRLRLALRRHRVLSAAAAVALVAGAGWAFSLGAAFMRLREQRSNDLMQYATNAMRNLQWDRAAVDYASALELWDRRDARLGLAISGENAPRPFWMRTADVGTIRAVAFTDGATVVAAGELGQAAAFDLQTGAELGRRKLAGPGAAADACGGAVALAVGNAVQLWRPRGDAFPASIDNHAPVRALSLSGDCALFATAASDGVRVFRVSGEQVASAPGDVLGVGFDGKAGLVWTTRDALFYSPDALSPAGPVMLKQPRPVHSLSVASGRALLEFEDGTVASFDLETKSLVAGSRLFVQIEHTILFPDGHSAVGFGMGFGTWFFDVDTGTPFDAFAAVSHPLFAVALTRDGHYLADGGEDRKLRIYDLAAARSYAGVLARQGAAAHDLAWSPGGAMLASAEEDGAVRLWDREGPKPREPLGHHHGPAYAVRFSPDGATLASAGSDGARLWNIANGSEVARVTGSFRALVWLPNSTLAIGGEKGSLVLREPSGVERRIEVGDVTVLSLAALPDGNGVACGDSSGRISIYDRRGALVARRSTADEKTILALAFSPDGKTLASGGSDGAVRIWDAIDLSPKTELETYAAGAVNALDFAPPNSPAAGLLLASNAEANATFWDPALENPVIGLGVRTKSYPPTVAARFSPDGRAFAVISTVGAARVISLDDRSPGAVERLMRIYKYMPAGLDVMRDNAALNPPALSANR